jgi:hypothetical protein
VLWPIWLGRSPPTRHSSKALLAPYPSEAGQTFFVQDTASQGVATGEEIEEQPRSPVGEVRLCRD